VFEIGTSLHEARLRKQIEIPEAEQGTKIRAKYLRALEDEQFELLPSPTYVKGFLRSYAEYLGLDGQLYVDEYNSRYVTGDDSGEPFRARRREASRARTRAHRRFEKSVVLVALAAIAVLTALVIAAWKFGGSSGSPKIQNLGQNTSFGSSAPQARTAAKRLVLRAIGSGTSVAVHLGSATGRVLFQGTVERGHPQTFPARTVWMTVDSPENLRVTLDGRTLAVPRPHSPITVLITRTGLVRSAA
jgi:cytoskeleton protein RodZ